MRITRTYTIETELIEKLKGVNASDLINELLNRYFDNSGDLDELRQKLIKKKKDCVELEKNIKSLENKQKSEIKGFTKLPHGGYRSNG